MQKQHQIKGEISKQFSDEISTEQTVSIDYKALNEKPQQVQGPKLGHIYSHSICTKSQRIIINTDQGFAIIKNSKVKKYFENGPFVGKERGTGVKISNLLSNRNLIALVPDRNKVITSESQGKLSLQTSSVYIYDININCIIYQRKFNLQITNVQLTQKYIIAGNSKRIIAIDYLQDKGNKIQLDDLFKLYQIKNTRLDVKYFQTGCLCTQSCTCGKIVSNIEEPRIIAFSYYNKKKVGIFNTELNYHYDMDTEAYQDLCISEDGKYLALTVNAGNYVQIIDIRTRKVFTQLRRGFQYKKAICMRFFKGWFGIVYESNNQATFHLFEIKQKQDKQYINSKVKRYFNTYSYEVDIMVCNNDFVIVSLMGASLKAFSLDMLGSKHADWKLTISSNQYKSWFQVGKEDDSN